MFPLSVFWELHFPEVKFQQFSQSDSNRHGDQREVSNWLCISFVSFVCFVVKLLIRFYLHFHTDESSYRIP